MIDRESQLRRSGRTTRLADAYIQELFVKGEITVSDHFNKKVMNQFLFTKIVSRMGFEHPFINITARKSNFTIKINKSDFTVKKLPKYQ